MKLKQALVCQASVMWWMLGELRRRCWTTTGQPPASRSPGSAKLPQSSGLGAQGAQGRATATGVPSLYSSAERTHPHCQPSLQSVILFSCEAERLLTACTSDMLLGGFLISVQQHMIDPEALYCHIEQAVLLCSLQRLLPAAQRP